MRSKLRLHKHLCDSRQPTSWESCSLLTHIKPMWDFILLLRVKQILKNCSTGHSSQMHKEHVFYLQLYWEITKFKGRSWENPVKSTKLLDYLLPNTSVYCLQHWRVLQEIKNEKYKHVPVAVRNFFSFFFLQRKWPGLLFRILCIHPYFRMSPDTRWHTIRPKPIRQVHKVRKTQYTTIIPTKYCLLKNNHLYFQL